MQQVFTVLRIPLAENEVGDERARLVSLPTAIPAEAVHCGARPSGDFPLAQQVQGVVRADLERVGTSRTQAAFRLEAQSESVEPTYTRRRNECVSRGTLERRIVERTEQRLRR